MSTFLDMQSRIADELQDDDIETGGQVAKAILDAIRLYRGKRFWFNQVFNQPFTLPTGTEYLAPVLPVSGISTTEPLTVIDQMQIDDGTGANYRKIGVVDDALIAKGQTGAVIGPPRYFSLVSDAMGTRLRFYPKPDQIYTPIVSALIRFADLSADTDTNPWTNDAEMLIRQTAKRIIRMDIDNQPDMPPGALESQALSELKKETRVRVGSVKLRTEVAGMQGRQMGSRYNIATDTYW